VPNGRIGSEYRVRLVRINGGRVQTCSASHKVKPSQSHDFDFFQNPKKVKVMTLTFFKIQKSQSPDFDFDLTF
jgi:hypothetical protein